MASLLQTANLGLPPDSYIYRIISTAPRTDPLIYERTEQLAVIASDDSLRLIDAVTLSGLPDGVISRVNEKVTCLERGNDAASNLILTAGRDGLVQTWDKRSKQKASSIQSPDKLISSLLSSPSTNLLALGIENPDDGASSSPVHIFDSRNTSTPVRTYAQSHTDTITSLAVHPSLPTLLLSSSTDGLINIFDTSLADEDDALYQVINHGSAVAHAGFMYPSTDAYAIGTDETLSFYGLQSQEEEKEEPVPKVYGDTRESFKVDYLVGMGWGGTEPFVAGGKHSNGDLTLIPVAKDAAAGALEYTCNTGASIRLPGGHGEEIVRDLVMDVHTHVMYTCGEDGHVRAWKLPGDGSSATMEGTAGKRDRKEKKKEKRDKNKGDEESKKGRFAPY